MSTAASFRFEALDSVINRVPSVPNGVQGSVSTYYGSKVFGIDAMREYLPDDAFSDVRNAVQRGERLSRKIADQVASSMKAWAIERGATHYTHWFQPLTGSTAEKHDAFFEPTSDGRAFESFGGNQLVQQEPDASSFPSGGLRNTFEARGYTAWDPTSPAFIIGKTLCIPTIFVSYTGDALDYKTPLLRALHKVDEAATAVCQYFDKNVTKVTATLGWEQEYFLVDSALYAARQDLALTGRTLFGHASAKDQQLEDHYFGSIPDRVGAFMRDFEAECLMLGIPVKTRHNEVAPNQFECAPVFEECNLAVDHNQLLMDVMEKTARRHNFRVLLHEKPYAGVNGSGKHNNWSLATSTGKNLLSPGSTPKTNLQFLTFFVNTIMAVHQHADLLRACIASAGNDHRLGANEAPPAIISIFIGSQLTNVLDDLVERVGKGNLSPDDKTALKLDIGKIPEILKDNTDRNRTSPFAFTGNKFELRAVGSSANCASAMTIMNAIMADQLKKFKVEVDKHIKKGAKKDVAILRVLRQYIIDSKNIRFEGNGYGDAWVKEAAKRGLSNVKTTPEALDAMITKEAAEFFSRNDIYTERELHARYEIQLETYTKKIQIESRVMGDLAINHIVPTAIRYQNVLLENVRGLKEVLTKAEYDKAAKIPLDTIKTISEHVAAITNGANEMLEARKKANAITDARKKAVAYCHDVKKYFEVIRYNVDKLELVIDDEIWPLPKYRELLFSR
ncbi:MAG: glutamine synthetase III [Flavobacteriales bacterium]|nr:glutamine synthetase III [Flavobacteriales bacterium]